MTNGEQIDMRLVGLHNCGLLRPQHSSNGLSLSAFVILNEYPMTRCYVVTTVMVVCTRERSIRDGLAAFRGSVTFHPWSGTGEITVRLILLGRMDGWIDWNYRWWKLRPLFRPLSLPISLAWVGSIGSGIW